MHLFKSVVGFNGMIMGFLGFKDVQRFFIGCSWVLIDVSIKFAGLQWDFQKDVCGMYP